jgi:ADP-ribose pyrophosphatase YjhB (NUDIX family)
VASGARRQRIAAYGVVRDDGGRLLLARASPALTLRGRWFLPGGGVQHGEPPAESLRREIEEESGLTVTLGPLLDVLSDVRTIPDGTSLHTVRLIYRVASWEGTLRPEADGTTDAVEWFTLDELRELPLARYVQDVVERLL